MKRLYYLLLVGMGSFMPGPTGFVEHRSRRNGDSWRQEMLFFQAVRTAEEKASGLNGASTQRDRDRAIA